MEFCPKCGAVLVKKAKYYGCPRCNYSTKNKINLSSSEELQDKREVAVVKDKDNELQPVVNEDCPKCGNDRAYFWTVQTRASDESETKFFKCTKCGHTRREYS
jgi:DNA-directed RNA polymerase subunit M